MKSRDTAKTPIEAFAINANGNGDGNVPGFGENYNYKTGLNEFCSACHTDYQRLQQTSVVGGTVSAGSGSTADAQGYYRHPTKIDLNYVQSTTGNSQLLTTNLPFANNGTQNLMICSTCHYAHGSVEAGDNQSKYDRNGDGVVNAADVSTMMKRLPYMGVCEDCHKK